MALLVHPERGADEGPSGYRHRLASANFLTFKDLNDLEMIGEVDAMSAYRNNPQVGAGNFDPWVRKYSRFCPACLKTGQTWLVGWELLFADACPACGSWLVDTCSVCVANVNWHRANLHRCDCGHFLKAESFSSAPPALTRLSRAFQKVALRLASTELPIFNGLQLEQCGRLVRLLGSYGNGDGGRLPQKTGQVDTLKMSWPISTMAAEILDSWPLGFHRLLDTLRLQSSPAPQGKLPSAFGGFYSALYKGFKDSQFAFLRTEFENYLSQHWSGAIGKRNLRLKETVLKTMAWIPASQACHLLGISRRRLNDLIEQGQVQGQVRTTDGNRNFIVVLRADVQKLSPTMDDGVPLADAARRLGFSKQRLLALLPIICPDAKKLGAQGCPWAIPVASVETWENLIQRQVAIEQPDSKNVAFAHLLRYWPWTDDQIADLLVAIFSNEVTPIGAIRTTSGIGTLVLAVDQVDKWFSGKQKAICAEVTIPELALRMGVKQEVAYSLVRSGLMQATVRKVGRRNEQRVKLTHLEEFERRYVYGRDIAKLLGRSPRATADFLLSEEVHPVTGPGVDHCRQLLYMRDDVAACFLRHGFGMPPLIHSLTTVTR
ncbi:hypothetical protein [Rhodoferax antarcticus]|uniref:hypothetical protein n=1 Tax=Rhodoferax antarcticus TaxID=81479 RepID=UPI002225A1AF|nr:hypothetical protein [Rhodoferax antarcticus]MCW2313712.1 hypothetical protein [Rhodoferax antarcticus]